MRTRRRRRKKRRNCGCGRRRKYTNSPVLERLTRRAGGKKALALFRKFLGVRTPPSVKQLSVSGIGKNAVLVGLGRSPAITLSDGPKGRPRNVKRRRIKGMLATDGSGKRLWVLSGKSSRSGKKRKRFIGYVAATEYVPTVAIERAGSFKKGKHWIHKMGEEGGTWPKAYQDGGARRNGHGPRRRRLQAGGATTLPVRQRQRAFWRASAAPQNVHANAVTAPQRQRELLHSGRCAVSVADRGRQCSDACTACARAACVRLEQRPVIRHGSLHG